MNLAKSLLSAALLLSAPAALADAPRLEASAPVVAGDEVHIPVSFSILPGLSTNGFTAGNVTNNFALGLGANYAGKVHGAALATGVNWVDHQTRGVLLAAGLNVASGDTKGAELSAGANIATGSFTGWQATAGFNLTTGEARGLQVSAGGNVASGGFAGLQTAAGMSYADRLAGAQLSVINVGGEVSGAQIGVINIARKVSGLQLGVINVSTELEGAPIGLISVVGNGQLHLQTFASDVSATNVALKYGGRHVYSLASVGYQPGDPDTRHWTMGLGLGGHLALTDHFYLDIDGLGSSVRESFIDTARNVLGQVRMLGGYSLAPHFSVFAGVTANAWVRWGDRDFAGLGERLAWERDSGSTQVRLWPGMVAGLQI